jgi:hypothetical protein
MKGHYSNVGMAALIAVGFLFAGSQQPSRTDELIGQPFAKSGSGGSAGSGDLGGSGQVGASVDPRLVLPATIDRALKNEIESATSSDALEQVLQRHPDQGQLIVPRIEALAVAEIRSDGPRDRFVIPGLEPDQGEGNSVTLQSTADRVTLVAEFPGDTARVRFSDGSVHRFVGRFPFADVVTLIGEGDKNHRLTFVVLDDQMIYVRGTGRAVAASGTLQFGASKP